MKNIIPKKVSNYELFYDLVFVFAVSVLTGMMHGKGVHLTFFSYLQFIISFIMLIKLWYHETMYLNKYGERDLMDIVTIILNMFVIGYMARELTLDWQMTYVSFNVLFLLSNVSVLLQYVLRARRLGAFSQTMIYHMKDIGVDMAVQIIWFIWLTVNPHMNIFWAYLLYGMSFLFVYLTRAKKEDDKANFPHLVERVQLITIIYFGETLIASIKTFDLATHFPEAVISFAMIGLMFIGYITQTAVIMKHHQERTGLQMVYVHIALLIGILFTTLMIEMAGDSHHFHDMKPLLILGLSLFYGSLQLPAPYNRKDLALTPKWLTAHLVSLVLALGLLTFYADSPILMLSFGLLAGLGQFTVAWYRLP